MPCSSVAPQIDQTHSRITYISLVSNKHPLQTDRSNILEQTNRSRRTLTSHTSTSPMQVKSASPLPPRINLATPKSKIVFTNTGNIYPLQLPFPQLSPSNPQHNNSPAFLR